MNWQDREDEARYGTAAVSGRAGYHGPGAFTSPARPVGGAFGLGRGGAAASTKQLYVGGVSPVLSGELRYFRSDTFIVTSSTNSLVGKT
jgi:hypothetical protein